MLAVLLLVLGLSCTERLGVVAEAEGPTAATIEQRRASGWRTAQYSLWLIVDGEETVLSKECGRTRDGPFQLASNEDGERYQWFDGTHWQTVYRIDRKPGLISDPRLSTAQQEWVDVQPLMTAAAEWLSSTPDEQMGLILGLAADYSASERSQLLLGTSRIEKSPGRAEAWLKLANDLPSDARDHVEQTLAAEVSKALGADPAVPDPLVRSLAQMARTSQALPEVLQVLMADSAARSKLTGNTFIELLRTVSQTDTAGAGQEACEWLLQTPADSLVSDDKHRVLPLIAMTGVECEAATTIASTLGYCCAKSCLPDELYMPSADLWSTTQANIKRDTFLLSYLRDTDRFPHLPAYQLASARLDYTQPEVGLSCLNQNEEEPCDCDLDKMRTASCMQPTKSSYSLSLSNCSFTVDDGAALFQSVHAIETRATRVYLEPHNNGLVCKVENQPVAQPIATYTWLADGQSFQRQTYGNPSMPAGLGRGSVPVAHELGPRDLPEDMPTDASFTCVVHFSNLFGDLKKVVLRKKGPRGTLRYKSEPSTMPE